MFERIATVWRNALPECWHFGAVAVATPDGRLVARFGDPEAATFLRSAAKPVQALPLVLAGGIERHGLDTADLALICASHGGTPAHTARALSLLERGGFSVDDLQCGAHVPMDAEAAADLRSRGLSPSPLHNNCSGKHAGMLLACRMHGWPASGYLEPDHPLQRAILDHLARLAGVPAATIGLGTDGCSVPSYHLTLAAAARVYAILAHPRSAVGLPAQEVAALERIGAAMAAAPEMVAGPGRFTTRLIAATGGRVVGKEGAEGFYGLAVRGPVALGIALKIADGGERCRDAVVLDVLRQLGSLAAAELSDLAGLDRPALFNHRGLRVGEIVSEVDLEDV